MAISMLQDAQARGLAAALAGIKSEDVDRPLSISPPMSANNTSTAIYPGFQQAAAATALGLMNTQFLAANRHAAAAFMAAQFPAMSTFASSLFPHHPAWLGSWTAPSIQPHLQLGAPHSPPASPLSPTGNCTTKTKNLGKHNVSMISPTDSIDAPVRKGRKMNVKQELAASTPIDSLNVRSDMYNTPNGPISPPSSGSSPNSTHDGSTPATQKDPSRDKSFTCKTCNRSFGYKHVLQNHERTHTGEKPFECPECHKRFTRDHHLKTHMRLHTGEKPYHCTHCDKQFVQVANLRRHLRVHTGERPYTCEVCDGRFSDSNQLKSHMLVHNGEKPFECERCHLKFRRRHLYLNHKCGIQSPPTPAISPAMSADYAISERKFAIGSSYGSEESMELGVGAQSNAHNNYDDLDSTESPLDLSEDAATIDGNKSHDIRQILRLPPTPAMHLVNSMPIQTEPEDLSMHSPRSYEQPKQSSSERMMIKVNPDDIDLDEVDDAETLYIRQQQNLAPNFKRCSGTVGMQMD